MEKAVLRVRRLMSCLGDPSRFRLVRALLERERCVTELAEAVGLSQSCTTRHLQALQREGLVRGRRDGKRVMFRLCSDEPRVSVLLRWAMQGGRVPQASTADRSSQRATRAPTVSKDRTRTTARDRPRATLQQHGTRKRSSEETASMPIEDVIQAPVDDAPALVSPSGPQTMDEGETAPARPAPRRHDLEDYLL